MEPNKDDWLSKDKLRIYLENSFDINTKSYSCILSVFNEDILLKQISSQRPESLLDTLCQIEYDFYHT